MPQKRTSNLELCSTVLIQPVKLITHGILSVSDKCKHTLPVTKKVIMKFNPSLENAKILYFSDRGSRSWSIPEEDKGRLTHRSVGLLQSSKFPSRHVNLISTSKTCAQISAVLCCRTSMWVLNHHTPKRRLRTLCD